MGFTDSLGVRRENKLYGVCTGVWSSGHGLNHSTPLITDRGKKSKPPQCLSLTVKSVLFWMCRDVDLHGLSNAGIVFGVTGKLAQ